jgi:peptidoglycan/xylan/chitin deacetylase (PgdA/CDA1 family)
MIMVEPLVSFAVDSGSPVCWARGLTVRLPASVATALNSGQEVSPGAASDLRLLRAYTDRAPTSSRLPIRYHVIPGWMRSLVAKGIGQTKRRSAHVWSAFPAWPLDLSADYLADAAGRSSPLAGARTPVILSHDLDSPEGLRNLHADFLRIEESFGARSTNYIVPCAWPIDHGLLGDVADRGHEIGVHGYDHSNLTPFLAPDKRRQRLEAAKDLIEKYRITGYRAPSLLRTRALIGDLKPLYRYDSSIPTTGGLFPMPNNGCASARPFMVEGIPEIPLSMPRDGSLIFLGYSPKEILAMWIACAKQIAASGGVVVLLTHCEKRFSGNSKMLNIYSQFLEYVASSPEFIWSTPEKVLAQWQEHLHVHP